MDENESLEMQRRAQLANAFGGGARPAPAPQPAAPQGPSLFEIMKSKFTNPSLGAADMQAARQRQGR